jgi:hypothetical protein
LHVSCGHVDGEEVAYGRKSAYELVHVGDAARS